MKSERDRSVSGRFDSIRWRILASMTFVAIAPLLIMAYQGYHCGRQAVVQLEEAHLRSMLEWRRSSIESVLGEVDRDLMLLAQTGGGFRSRDVPPAGKPSNGSEPHPIMHCANGDFHTGGCLCKHNYDMLVHYDSDWNVITCPMRPEGDLPPPPAALKARLERTNALTVDISPMPTSGGDVSPKMGLFVGRPLVGDDGVRRGYVLGCLDLIRMIEPILTSPDDAAHASKVFLIGPDGWIRGAPVERADWVDAPGYMPSELINGQSSRVLEYPDHRGVPVLGTSSAIPALNATLVAEIDRDIAFAWLGVLKGRAIVTGIITIALILVLAFRSAANLAYPLQKLSSVSQRIAQGERSVRLTSLRGAEAREVANAFNLMLDRLAESQRRLLQAASLAAIGELSSSIVHEMRNPLSSVKLNLQALSRRLADDPVYRELSEIALAQARRLESMLNDLLNYGKPLKLHIQTASLERMVAEVFEVVRGEASVKEARLQVSDSPVLIELEVDPESFKRALTNLISNAIQATPFRGEVKVKAIDDEPERGMVTIMIEDQGDGVPDHVATEIFQPFFTTREDGTGLGLANVKKIIEYHDGAVSFENRHEGGARFRISLPKRRNVQ